MRKLNLPPSVEEALLLYILMSFRYFGGDLHIMSMEGYGTDAFIYLPRLTDKSGNTAL